MDIRTIFAVEIRAVGSDKTLIRIDGLNEAEQKKVFENIQLPTRGEGYEKLMLFESQGQEMIGRRSPLTPIKPKVIIEPIIEPEPEAPVYPPFEGFTRNKKRKVGGDRLGDRPV